MQIFGANFDDVSLDTMKFHNASLCTNSEGLLGNCNSQLLDDLSNSTGALADLNSVTQEYIHEDFASHWTVSALESLFVYQHGDYDETRELEGGGYCLSFDNTGLYVKNIFSFPADSISVEFLIKVSSSKGIIMSYSAFKTFALSLDGTVYIHYGDMEPTNTLSALEIGKWNKISVKH